MPAPNLGKLTFGEKVGYSLADGAAQFVFSTMLSFQNFFYTNTMQIDPFWAGNLVLIARLWDAFFDPVMGFIADRTRTRWGRFRPWLLWTSIPWAVAMVLAYTVPGFGSMGTFVYALVTNIVLMTIYSMNNTPYSALMAVMTGDVKERTRLSQYRFIVAMIGQLVVAGLTMALVEGYSLQHFQRPPEAQIQAELAPLKAQAAAKSAASEKNVVEPTEKDTSVWKEARRQSDAYGWEITISIYAVICVACFLVTFFTVRERIGGPGSAESGQGSKTGPPGSMPELAKKASVKADLALLIRTGPWAAMFLVTLTHYILAGIRGPTYIYYFKYVLDQDALVSFVGQWGLPVATPGSHPFWYKVLDNFKLIIAPDHSNVAAVANGLLGMSLKVCSVIGIIAASFLVARFNKRVVVAVSLVINTVFIFALYFVPYQNVWAVFVLEWLGALAYAPVIPLLWVLFADVVDYSEWKSHRRITGLIYSTFFFALKAGLSLGGAMASWILGGYGYDPKHLPPMPTVAHPGDASIMQGIVLTFSVFPGIFSIGCAASMFLFRITKQMNHEIAEELASRRAAAAALAAPEDKS